MSTEKLELNDDFLELLSMEMQEGVLDIHLKMLGFTPFGVSRPRPHLEIRTYRDVKGRTLKLSICNCEIFRGDID